MIRSGIRSGCIEKLLWAAGGLCAACCLFLYVQAKVAVAHADAGSPPSMRAASANAPGDILGHLQIPAIGLSVAILDNDDSGSLRRGVGHIPGTAMLGGLGTVALAGHRDTFLKPLRNVTPHMSVELTDRTGRYYYSVDSTEIVMPDAVDVIATRAEPELVLITCYPFNYIGAAPKRFVVHAHLLSVAPDSPHEQL